MLEIPVLNYLRDLAEKDVIRIGSHKYLFMPLCRDGFFWDEEGSLR